MNQFPNRQPQHPGLTVDRVPCSNCTLSDQRSDVLREILAKYQGCSRLDLRDNVDMAPVAQYFAERLKLPDRLKDVALSRLRLLRLAGVPCQYNERICLSDRYKHLVEKGMSEIAGGNLIQRVPYLEMLNEMWLDLLQNPSQCLTRIKDQRFQEKQQLEQERGLVNCVFQIIHGKIAHWTAAKTEVDSVMKGEGSLRQKIEVYLQHEHELAEYVTFRHFANKIIEFSKQTSFWGGFKRMLSPTPERVAQQPTGMQIEQPLPSRPSTAIDRYPIRQQAVYPQPSPFPQQPAFIQINQPDLTRSAMSIRTSQTSEANISQSMSQMPTVFKQYGSYFGAASSISNRVSASGGFNQPLQQPVNPHLSPTNPSPFSRPGHYPI